MSDDGVTVVCAVCQPEAGKAIPITPDGNCPECGRQVTGVPPQPAGRRKRRSPKFVALGTIVGGDCLYELARGVSVKSLKEELAKRSQKDPKTLDDYEQIVFACVHAVQTVSVSTQVSLSFKDA